jgi:hypothetical protein
MSGPKFKNIYTYTEVIKTDKFIVVIDDYNDSNISGDFQDYYDIEYDISHSENDLEDFWEFSFDLIYLVPVKIIIEKHDIKTLKIKNKKYLKYYNIWKKN